MVPQCSKEKLSRAGGGERRGDIAVNRMVREGLSVEIAFEQSNEENEWGMGLPGGGMF